MKSEQEKMEKETSWTLPVKDWEKPWKPFVIIGNIQTQYLQKTVRF
jgi:hypothetical protein